MKIEWLDDLNKEERQHIAICEVCRLDGPRMVWICSALEALLVARRKAALL